MEIQLLKFHFRAPSERFMIDKNFTPFMKITVTEVNCFHLVKKNKDIFKIKKKWISTIYRVVGALDTKMDNICLNLQFTFNSLIQKIFL
jgi:hypothetical protein